MKFDELAVQLQGIERAGHWVCVDSGIEVPVRFHRNNNSDQLVILLNGAVDRKRSSGPVFQRSSWVEGINANVLNVADPTIAEGNTLSIGWGQGNGGKALESMSGVIKRIADAIDVPHQDRIYYGSSAGGFQALQLASRDRGASVIVNNPQTDWTYYLPSSVRSVLRDCYSEENLISLRDNYPENCSAARAIISSGYLPKILYFVNAASKSDINTHLFNFLKTIKSSNLYNEVNRIAISYYSDLKAGHNPLPKKQTLEIINNELKAML